MFKYLFFSSTTYKIYLFLHNKILTNPLYLFFTDFSFISELWHKSQTYSLLSGKLSFISEKIYKPSGIFLPLSCLLPILFCMFLPSQLHRETDLVLMSILSLLLNIRFSNSKKACTDSLFFTAVWFFFLIFFLKNQSFYLLSRLFVFAAFYFSVISSVKESRQFEIYKRMILLLSIATCVQTIIFQNTLFYNQHLSAEKIILITTPALSATYYLKSDLRKFLYFISILLCSYYAIFQSSSALLGFSISIIVFIGLLNIKYLLLLLVISPTVIIPPILQLVDTFAGFTKRENFWTSIVYTALNFWMNGMNISSQSFLSLYRSATSGQQHLLHFEPYVKAIISLGFFIIFITLWYNLKLIRSTVVKALTGPQKYKPIFAGGISSLIGISLYSLLNIFSLNPYTLICYAMVLGMLSAQNRAKENP